MAELSCGKTCMKYILFVINFIFFVLGAAAFGLGIWALVDKNKMKVLTKVGAENSDFNVVGLLESTAIVLMMGSFTILILRRASYHKSAAINVAYYIVYTVGGLLESAAIVLMVGGIAILIIGFLGCCGAMKESTCLLCLYGILLGIILVIELAAIIIAAVFRTRVEDELKDFLKKTINSTYEGRIDTAEEFSLGLDYAQVYFQCCGIDSYKDFEGATKWNKTTSSGDMVIPPTCCKLSNKDDYFSEPSSAQLEDENCPTNPTTTNSNQNKPCWDEIYNYLQDRIAIVIGIAAAIVALELICLVFACCVLSAIRKEG